MVLVNGMAGLFRWLHGMLFISDRIARREFSPSRRNCAWSLVRRLHEIVCGEFAQDCRTAVVKNMEIARLKTSVEEPRQLVLKLAANKQE